MLFWHQGTFQLLSQLHGLSAGERGELRELLWKDLGIREPTVLCQPLAVERYGVPGMGKQALQLYLLGSSDLLRVPPLALLQLVLNCE